jgi:hypothetical protein
MLVGAHERKEVGSNIRGKVDRKEHMTGRRYRKQNKRGRR